MGGRYGDYRTTVNLEINELSDSTTLINRKNRRIIAVISCWTKDKEHGCHERSTIKPVSLIPGMGADVEADGDGS
jgi:hypothetical protein